LSAACYGIAADIGTTTVALALVRLSDGETVAVDSFLNPQKRYGADVIARIKNACSGHGARIRDSIASALGASASRLCAASGVAPRDVVKASVAGNTTMMHLLLGLPCEGLARSPFTPAAISFPDLPLSAVFTGFADCAGCVDSTATVSFSPAVSAFVGGDIVAGLASLDFGGSAGVELFVDLGTNAEMALSSGGKVLCASAAAGPAFEGGEVSCGSGCVPGAISSVFLEGNKFAWRLVAGVEQDSRAGQNSRAQPDLKPVGLCGSAILDLVALSLELGLVQEDGSLSPVCEESGIVLDAGLGIRMTGADVRAILLARAAIRAGIAVLLDEARIGEADVTRVHLAGGFGYYLKEESALRAGILPRAFAGKISRPGNTSLAGAVRSLVDPVFRDLERAIASRSKLIELARSPSFNGLFVDAMRFD